MIMPWISSILSTCPITAVAQAEVELNNLKGFAKFTKEGELQNQINLKNENIDILKTGLSGIVRRYGFQNVQDFYQAYQKAYRVYVDYKEIYNKWESTYGENAQKILHERLQNYKKVVTGRQAEQIGHSKNIGVR